MWPLTPYSPQTHCNSLVNVGIAGKLVYLVKWGHLVKLEASESASMPSEAGMRRALQKMEIGWSWVPLRIWEAEHCAQVQNMP